jgi:hypothetical protein
LHLHTPGNSKMAGVGLGRHPSGEGFRARAVEAAKVAAFARSADAAMIIVQEFTAVDTARD